MQFQGLLGCPATNKTRRDFGQLHPGWCIASSLPSHEDHTKPKSTGLCLHKFGQIQALSSVVFSL